MVKHVTGFMRHYAAGPLAMESVVLVNEAASNKLSIGAPQDGMFKHTLCAHIHLRMDLDLVR